MDSDHTNSYSYFNKLLDIGIALTAEKDYNKLLEMILTEARSITNADGGTLYICESNQLKYKIMQNTSLNVFKGGAGEEIGIPPVEMVHSNVSAYAALTRQTVNISNVYNSELFDFSGPKKFDAAVGYTTRSMLVTPLINREDKVIGVLQLINSIDSDNSIVPFDDKLESIVKSLASQAGMAMANMQYIEEIKQFFDSFVKVMATAIDERTPYNASHSRNIAILVEKFALYINTIDEGKYKDVNFSATHIKQLVTTAWLHDIGKLAVPISVLDKPTRLSDGYELLMLRLNLIESKLRANYLEECLKSPDNSERYKEIWKDNDFFIKEVKEFVTKVNEPSTFVDDAIKERLIEIKNRVLEGIEEKLITDSEFENLSIKKGTLTNDERVIIESHVSVAERILSKMEFPDYLKNVPEWAIRHHEFLDGSGYCKKCKEDQLPLEVRILTILDIFDALTAKDRPYKAGMPVEKALQILGFMVKEGKLDGDLLEAFSSSKCWALTED